MFQSHLHGPQGAVKVGSGSDGHVVVVDELQREVSHDPQKVWKVLGEVLARLSVAAGLLFGLSLDVLGEFYDEGEGVERALVDGAHRVVDKVGGEEQGQRENLGIVVLAETFKIQKP
jgi:hypothetical protein